MLPKVFVILINICRKQSLFSVHSKTQVGIWNSFFLFVSVKGTLCICMHTHIFAAIFACLKSNIPVLLVPKAELKSPNKVGQNSRRLSQLRPQVTVIISTDRHPFCSLLLHSIRTPSDLQRLLASLGVTAAAILCRQPSQHIVSNITLVKMIQPVCLCDQWKHLASATSAAH